MFVDFVIMRCEWKSNRKEVETKEKKGICQTMAKEEGKKEREGVWV